MQRKAPIRRGFLLLVIAEGLTQSCPSDLAEIILADVGTTIDHRRGYRLPDPAGGFYTSNGTPKRGTDFGFRNLGSSHDLLVAVDAAQFTGATKTRASVASLGRARMGLVDRR